MASTTGAGERGELSELAGAERKSRVVHVTPCVSIGQRRNADGRSMGRHVPAIGKQRHRTENRAADNLAGHHREGQADNEPGAPFIARMRGAEKDVIVRPVVERMRMHIPPAGVRSGCLVRVYSRGRSGDGPKSCAIGLGGMEPSKKAHFSHQIEKFCYMRPVAVSCAG